MPHSTPHKKRVVLALSRLSNFGESVMRGIFTHPASAQWGMQIIRAAADFTPEAVKAALVHRTEGFILALDTASPEACQLLATSKVPFVTVDSYLDILKTRTTHAAFVRVDNTDIGRAAALSFIGQGRYAAFAFVPPIVSTEWSRLREKGFRATLEKRGLFCETFPPPAETDTLSDRGYLAKWIRHLPRPVAILAADDHRAYAVLQACTAARLSIPSDVAILGIDDDDLICETSTPSLSSIRPNFAEAGRKAAEVLEQLLSDRKKSTPARTLFVPGDNTVIHRQSTTLESPAGPLVQKALAFIAKNARQGIGVRDVVAHLGVSRSLVDTRFREVCGQSVLSHILEARLKELRHLLIHTNDPIESITRRLGWKSPNYPKNLFKRQFGLSMRDWRIRERAALSD